MSVATAPTDAPALPAAPDDVSESRDSTLFGMAMVVVADAMVFVGLLAAYYALRAQAFVWPPKGVDNGTYLPAVVTLTVLMTMATAQWAVYAVRRDDQRNCLWALGITMVLGLAIVNAEWYDYGRLGFSISKHSYGTMHYLLTGFHLVNVIAGIVMLGVVAVRILAGDYDSKRHDAVRAVALFWQFVSFAWIVVVFALVIYR